MGKYNSYTARFKVKIIKFTEQNGKKKDDENMFIANFIHILVTAAANLKQDVRLQQYKKWYPLRHNKVYEIPPDGTSFITFSQVSDCSCDAWPVSNQFTFKADDHYFQGCNKQIKERL
jgi:hypothetical protein